MNAYIIKNPGFIILLFLFLFGFFVRLYKFDGPIADWHSWRQADTSSVSRNYAISGINLLYPKFDDISNVPSRIDNPNGYRFVEFPIYNSLQALTFMTFGVLTIEQWGRLITIFASLISALMLYLLIVKRFGKGIATLTCFFFLFLPFNVYYSRTILPDPSMVLAILTGTYFFEKWIERKEQKVTDINFLLALIFTLVSFLLKPYALFFTLSMIYLAFEKYGKSFVKKWQLWLFMLISLAPLIAWRFWIMKFPEGIPYSIWLFNGNHIRFRPSFFYWILYERLTKLILGFWGLIFLASPFIFIKHKKKEILYIGSFVLSSVLYVTVLATGNVQHDYYQVLIIPSICMLLGIGSYFLINKVNSVKNYLGYVLFILIVSLSFYSSWGIVKGYYYVNNPSIISAGKAIDKLVPVDAKIVAPYEGDTSFLYQTKRKGWASFEKPLPEMINNLGADYLVLVNPTQVDLGIGKTYKIVTSNKQYVIFNLREKP